MTVGSSRPTEKTTRAIARPETGHCLLLVSRLGKVQVPFAVPGDPVPDAVLCCRRFLDLEQVLRLPWVVVFIWRQKCRSLHGQRSDVLRNRPLEHWACGSASCQQRQARPERGAVFGVLAGQRFRSRPVGYERGTTSGSMCRRQIAAGNSWTCECEESPARSATAGAPWLYEAMGVHGFLNFERACALPRILCFRNRLSHMLSGTCPHLRRAARPGRTPRAKIKKQLRDGHSTHCGEEHLVSVALPRGQCHAAFQTYLTCDDMMYTGME